MTIRALYHPRGTHGTPSISVNGDQHLLPEQVDALRGCTVIVRAAAAEHRFEVSSVHTEHATSGSRRRVFVELELVGGALPTGPVEILGFTQPVALTRKPDPYSANCMELLAGRLHK